MKQQQQQQQNKQTNEQTTTRNKQISLNLNKMFVDIISLFFSHNGYSILSNHGGEIIYLKLWCQMFPTYRGAIFPFEAPFVN